MSDRETTTLEGYPLIDLQGVQAVTASQINDAIKLIGADVSTAKKQIENVSVILTNNLEKIGGTTKNIQNAMAALAIDLQASVTELTNEVSTKASSDLVAAELLQTKETLTAELLQTKETLTAELLQTKETLTAELVKKASSTDLDNLIKRLSSVPKYEYYNISKNWRAPANIVGSTIFVVIGGGASGHAVHGSDYPFGGVSIGEMTVAPSQSVPIVVAAPTGYTNIGDTSASYIVATSGRYSNREGNGSGGLLHGNVGMLLSMLRQLSFKHENILTVIEALKNKTTWRRNLSNLKTPWTMSDSHLPGAAHRHFTDETLYPGASGAVFIFYRVVE